MRTLLARYRALPRFDLMTLCLAFAIAMMGFHVHTVRVLSPSMEPAIGAGDLALVRTIPTTDLRVGMVVLAKNPTTNAYYLHRITKLRPSSGSVAVHTRGDSNPLADPWVDHLTAPNAYVMFARVPLGWFGEHLPVL